MQVLTKDGDGDGVITNAYFVLFLSISPFAAVCRFWLVLFEGKREDAGADEGGR